MVLRARADGRIEARWPTRDLCQTYDGWVQAVERVVVVTAWLGLPLRPRFDWRRSV